MDKPFYLMYFVLVYWVGTRRIHSLLEWDMLSIVFIAV